MKLSVKKRSAKLKSEVTTIRREGDIPAIIYSKGEAGEPVSVSGVDFSTARRQITQGHLPTTVLTLTEEAGTERRVLVKGIDYHPTTYNVLHLDLMELHDDQEINVKVPIVPLGAADCVGIKLGGVLRQVIRHVLVRCVPKNLPEHFTLDVRDLQLKQVKRLKDIVMPANVRPMAEMNEVAMVIAKR